MFARYRIRTTYQLSQIEIDIMGNRYYDFIVHAWGMKCGFQKARVTSSLTVPTLYGTLGRVCASSLWYAL